MSYIPPEIVNEAKKVDLLSYLQFYAPNELIHISGNTYCTRTHDSLKISNGLWNWFSKGIGGKNAIDYLMKVEENTFVEAVRKVVMIDKVSIPISDSNTITANTNKTITIPKRANNFKRAKDYLINRGIAEEIIDECYKNKLLYQEEITNNVVFLGYDNEGNIKYAGVRATNETRFMKDAEGSDKAYSFRILSNTKNDTIHVFESSIDLLSYATLLYNKGIDFKKKNLISLSGVYQPAKVIENSKIPIAIDRYLNDNQNIKNIVLHFDRDFAGRNATKALQIVIPKKYIIVDAPVPIGKDVNDFLCYKLGLKRFKNEHER